VTVHRTAEPESGSASLRDRKLDVKIALGGLWTAMLFVYAYVDIFGFFRTDVIEGALAGRISSGAGFEIDQTFLLLTTIFVTIPILMIVVSLLAPARVNRPVNLVVSLIYAASAAASAVGETWVYYVVGTAVEVLLMLAVVRSAWTWPRDVAR